MMNEKKHRWNLIKKTILRSESKSGYDKSNLKTVIFLIFVTICTLIQGQLPQMTLDRASKSIKDMLFKNSVLGIFISENSSQVKLPLKTTSTLNQLFKVSPFLDLDCFLRQNTISQKVTVNELSSKVCAVAIPFHVVVWLDKSSQIDKIYNCTY